MNKPRIRFGRRSDMKFGPWSARWWCEGCGWLAHGDSPVDAFSKWQQVVESFA